MKNTGEIFENKVYMVLKNIKETNGSWITKEMQLHKGKSYYSKDRNKKIKTDISIEWHFPKSTKPTIIWIWECKDYKNNIPVDDIEEFHSKLEQIGADNTKGTVIISNSNFQESAFNYALSKKIGLVRLLPDNQIEHLAYNCPPKWWYEPFNKSKEALIKLDFISENWPIYGIASTGDGIFSLSLNDYIKNELAKIENYFT